jgi:hypothetical protein
VAAVVPVALPCTPRGVWQGAACGAGGTAPLRTGRRGTYTAYTPPLGLRWNTARRFVVTVAVIRRTSLARDFNLGGRGIRTISRPRSVGASASQHMARLRGWLQIRAAE